MHEIYCTGLHLQKSFYFNKSRLANNIWTAKIFKIHKISVKILVIIILKIILQQLTTCIVINIIDLKIVNGKLYGFQ